MSTQHSILRHFQILIANDVPYEELEKPTRPRTLSCDQHVFGVGYI